MHEQLWRRGGYGTASTTMIREHPLFGVGVGSFNWLSGDYTELAGEGRQRPDNAQNWIRHLLAEIGVLGLLHILWWCGLFACGQ